MSKQINRDVNKSTPPIVSVPPQQSKAMDVSAQPPKAPPVSTRQAIQDISHSKPVATAAPTNDDIAKRAYQIYVERGCPQGQSEQIWRQAELELRKRAFTASSSR